MSSKPRASVAVSLLMLATACSQAPKMRGQIAGLEEIVKQAERNGALRCAPRELAVARSQLHFASIELDQGFISKAEAHLWRAEPNAHAALDMSPPQYCAERGFVESAPGDRDGDGYLDPEDTCPDEPENFNGYQDPDGCPDDPDTDGDGLVDSLDSCVLEPEDKDNYLDDDGCPELDNDVDTLDDTGDKCPLEAEDPDGYEDTDGCPDPDNDKDTVLDVKDQCPNEIGSTTQEPLGCPTKPALVVVTDCEVKITQQIHFEFNKDKIRPESFPVLDAVVEVLQKNPEIKIEVQGHTDNKGNAKYNKDLSNRRSASVRKYLVSHGIAPERLTSLGYGFDRPLVDNSTEQNRALNRRVQFVRTEGVKEGCPKTGTQ
ncbi:MAG TPA: OmpA family protein [Polyangiaceae bacterium]|jgi:outer membrane protein OmpA-like peptidoglycan-associated protein|nr:OmpA family protein [Polyangiaceae bacterium]